MKKFLVVLSLAFVINVVSVGETFGQLGLGIKLPSTEVFISNFLDDGTLIELGVSLASLSNASIVMSGTGKLLLSPAEIGVVLRPFFGLGTNVSFVLDGVLIRPYFSLGVETPVPDSRISAFLEMSMAVGFSRGGILFFPRCAT